MKQLILLTAIIISTSCSQYVQVATFHSDSVFLDTDKDTFSYTDDVVSINYKFNNKDAIFDFTIINHSDKDITISTDKSYFVYNGHVYDYARWSYSSEQGYHIIGVYSAITHSSQTTYTIGDTLIIPAGCYRVFNSFSIDRPCYYNKLIMNGFNENKDTHIYFMQDNSPVSLINAITYIYDGVEYNVKNEMYMQSIHTYKISEDERLFIGSSIFNNQIYQLVPINAYLCDDCWMQIDD